MVVLANPDGPFAVVADGDVQLTGLVIHAGHVGAVHARGGSVTMRECAVEAHGLAVIARGASCLEMVGCTVAAGRLVVQDATGLITDSTLSGSLDNAVAAVDGGRLGLDGCTISDTVGQGVYLKGSAASIANCRFTRIGSDALGVTQGSVTSVRCCTIATAYAGIAADQTSGGTFDEVEIRDTRIGVNATLAPADAPVRPAEPPGLRITASRVTDSDIGVRSRTSRGPSMTGCRIERCRTAADVEGGTSRLTEVQVTGSDIGVRVSGGGDVRVRQSRIGGCGVGVDVAGPGSVGGFTEVYLPHPHRASCRWASAP
jgi:hypothetical protein